MMAGGGRIGRVAMRGVTGNLERKQGGASSGMAGEKGSTLSRKRKRQEKGLRTVDERTEEMLGSLLVWALLS